MGDVGTTGPGVNRPTQLLSHPQPTTHTLQPNPNLNRSKYKTIQSMTIAATQQKEKITANAVAVRSLTT